jgi:hypothetical protein
VRTKPFISLLSTPPAPTLIYISILVHVAMCNATVVGDDAVLIMFLVICSASSIVALHVF